MLADNGDRVLGKGVSAEVQIALRSTNSAFATSGALGNVKGIPLEPFAANKDMGRILIRRGGETIAAGTFHSFSSGKVPNGHGIRCRP